MAYNILTLLLLAITVHPLFSAPLPCILYPDYSTNCPTQQKQCCIENFKLKPCTCVESFDSYTLVRRFGQPSDLSVNIDLPREELINDWFSVAKICFPYYELFDNISEREKRSITYALRRDLPGSGNQNVNDVCPRIRRKVKAVTTLDIGLP